VETESNQLTGKTALVEERRQLNAALYQKIRVTFVKGMERLILRV